MTPEFGVRLKATIQRSGLKQNQLADQLGVSGSMITQWCKGESRPSLDTFSELCLVLKVQPCQLLYGKAIESEDEVILKAVYRFRPSVRKALVYFLNLI